MSLGYHVLGILTRKCDDADGVHCLEDLVGLRAPCVQVIFNVGLFAVVKGHANGDGRVSQRHDSGKEADDLQVIEVPQLQGIDTRAHVSQHVSRATSHQAIQLAGLCRMRKLTWERNSWQPMNTRIHILSPIAVSPFCIQIH